MSQIEISDVAMRFRSRHGEVRALDRISLTVPDEMLNVAYTLGASRWTVFYKVFLPATFPEVVDALRITMGWA